MLLSTSDFDSAKYVQLRNIMLVLLLLWMPLVFCYCANGVARVVEVNAWQSTSLVKNTQLVPLFCGRSVAESRHSTAAGRGGGGSEGGLAQDQTFSVFFFGNMII